MNLRSAPCGYVAFDDARRITTVNDDALRYLGYEASELVGQRLELLLPPSVRILFHTNVYPALAAGRRAEEIYALLRCKNGDELPVLFNAARRDLADGAETDCVFLAVKRRNLFERQLQRLETHSAAASTSVTNGQPANELTERLATLGVLLAGVMHEVKNPLTYVRGYIDLLSCELDDAARPLSREQLLEYVREASDGVSRVVELVSAVGMMSRVESAPPAPVDVGRIVDGAVRLVRHRIIRFAELTVEGPRPGPSVLGHEGRLAQVVMNLVINAGQALQSSAQGDGRICVSSFIERQHAVISVSDNGPGVPAALRERIFEPFYTTKPVGEGTGLGLAISREIVASLGGHLELVSTPEGGATFQILLPLLNEELTGL